MISYSNHFSMRRLFIATAYLSAGCALAALIFRVGPTVNGDMVAVLSFFGPFAVLVLMNAGIGQLFHQTRQGPRRGLSAGLLFFFALLALVIGSALWRIW
jgi:hypothetical protein